MTVTLETFVKCPACSHPIRFIAVTTIRVNKKSIRATGKSDIMLGAFEDWRCPGCRQEIPRDGALEREPYRLVAEDALKVAEYRKRKWGIEGDAAA